MSAAGFRSGSASLAKAFTWATVVHASLRRLLFSGKHEFPSTAFGTWYNPKKHHKDFIFEVVLL